MQTWKQVVGFEGLYEISSDGELRSYHRSRKRPTIPHEMKFKTDHKGYKTVILRKDNTHHLRKAHRMVAQAFLCNKANLPAVNHIDGVKTNNNVSNLEWCTNKQNSLHAKEKNLLVQGEPKRGTKNGMAKLTDEQVKHIRLIHISGSPIYGTKALARDYSVSPTTIYGIIQRKTWFHV